MKKILILLFVCFSIHATAQTQKERVDKLVSSEQVSTGILYNRISPLVDLHLTKKDTFSQEYFKQAYFELFNASYKTDKMLSMKLLNDFVYHQSTQNIVSIGALLYDFNYTEALSAEKVMAKDFTPPQLIENQ